MISPPKPKRDKNGEWWIPRFPPHWFKAMGPYTTRAEADDDRQGVERCINTPLWRSIIQDIEDEEI